jgi:uncharacterized lipoprotein YmbA
MNTHRARNVLLALATAGSCLAGCSFLKPSGIEPRLFLLTPLPAVSVPAGQAVVSLGIGTVKVPSYLLKNSMEVRRGTNEVAFLDGTVWAERLDLALQRVLAANLAALLPSDRVHLSAWQPEAVNVEVYVTVEQFDVDEHGAGVLSAWWRLVSPGGEKELKTGHFRSTRTGPAAQASPEGAVATLSALAADLSRELGAAIKSTTQR